MKLLSILLAIGFFAINFIGGNRAISFAQTSETMETHKVVVDEKLAYTNVNAAGLAIMLTNKDFLFVNVHIPYEGEIEKTDIFIPFNEIEKNLDKLPADRDAKIVLYCRTDRMSNIAAGTLVKLGYTNVWNLEGGMIKWQQEGHPLLNKNR